MVSMSRAEMERPEGGPSRLRAEQTLDLLLGVGISRVRDPAWSSANLGYGWLTAPRVNSNEPEATFKPTLEHPRISLLRTVSFRSVVCVCVFTEHM